jgi:hypothetical protein
MYILCRLLQVRVLKIIVVLFFGLKAYGQLNTFIINDLEVNLSQDHLPFYNKARLSIETRQYVEAIPHLDSLQKYYSSSTSIIFLSGVCKIYTEETKAQALTLLKALNKKSSKLSNYNFWLGLAYEKNDSTVMATAHYTKFITEAATETDEDKEYVNRAKNSLDNVKSMFLWYHPMNLL